MLKAALFLKAIDHSPRVEATLRHDLDNFTETMGILSLSTPQWTRKPNSGPCIADRIEHWAKHGFCQASTYVSADDRLVLVLVISHGLVPPGSFDTRVSDDIGLSLLLGIS